jgi:hypothetical protein
MGGACNFIFSKSVLGLVAIGASACLHGRKQNLAIRSHAYERHTCILDLPSSGAGRRRHALINRSGTVKSRGNQKPVKYRVSIFLFRRATAIISKIRATYSYFRTGRLSMLAAAR